MNVPNSTGVPSQPVRHASRPADGPVSSEQPPRYRILVPAWANSLARLDQKRTQFACHTRASSLRAEYAARGHRCYRAAGCRTKLSRGFACRRLCPMARQCASIARVARISIYCETGRTMSACELCAFDLWEFNGAVYREKPLLKRKRRLARLLKMPRPGDAAGKQSAPAPNKG